jgi:hypothetical protein
VQRGVNVHRLVVVVVTAFATTVMLTSEFAGSEMGEVAKVNEWCCEEAGRMPPSVAVSSELVRSHQCAQVRRQSIYFSEEAVNSSGTNLDDRQSGLCGMAGTAESCRRGWLGE